MRGAFGLLLACAALCAAAPQAAQEAIGIQLTGARLVRTPPPGVLGARANVDAETEFLTIDPAAFYLVNYTGGHKDDKFRVEWRNPLGTVIQHDELAQIREGGQLRLVWRLLIAGAPASFTPGNWEVRLFWNDRGIAVTAFKISAPPESIVSISNRTLLPQATLTVPYRLQLTARGGTGPYRWTASKALPEGLALSETGSIGGTPQRRGSFRAILTATDSAGNSVTRIFGIAVGVAAANGVQAGNRNLLKSAVPDACSQTASQTDFSAGDSTVVLAATLDAPRGREGRIEWLNPRGDIFQVNRVNKTAERQECIVKALPLAGHKAALDPGDWRVRLFWADAEVFTLKFTVNAAKTATAAAATRAGRLALLVANQRYEKLPASASANADIDALASVLQQDRFEVVRMSDANLDNLRQIEHTLEDKLQAGDTVLVYYAGYDSRGGGDDWLLPVNFDPGDTRPIQSRAYSAIRLMQWLADSKAGLKFIFLDGAPAAGQPADDPAAVLGEVDDSTALVYSRSPAPGAFARALAEVLGEPDLDARTLLEIELLKALTRIAPSVPSPVAIVGGGGDFVFRGAAAARF
jgi:hypothetical protein